MSTRKKNAEPPRHNKPKQVESPPPPTIDIDALLMVGEERVHIVYEEDDNIAFMTEVIDTL
ncbi:hypothetical protein [Duganella levis]|uniref:Uncharacterized protein n=1 Tax=Duganella levis TaxID=2692169 RepID=A0ABW9W497_9BURK|nr:hypothetical protein [Duganella levis]MYN28744.1 hypothetical protein [Duganella levis]